MLFYLTGEHHTLASVLSPALEKLSTEEEFVSCSLLHPLDTFLLVDVPSEKHLRNALLAIKDDLQRARKEVRH